MMDTAPHLDSTLVLHRLVIRDSEDDPDAAVVGRTALGEFIELPRVGAEAVRQLGDGATVAAVEERIAAEHQVRLDVVELAEVLIDLGFVASIDSRKLPDPADGLPGSHLPWLRPRHVRWLFGRPMAVLWVGLLLATAATWVRRPGLLPAAGDFFWTPYVGVAVLVNTVLFSINASVHEFMHLAAARLHGAPARISLGTRLHHLVVQTDVTAIWAVPRRHRIRVYLAGLYWDSAVVCGATLVVAYASLPSMVDSLLAALVLVVILSMALQAQVFMRTDLYYVLMEWLHTVNLFADGLAYARHLLRRLCGRASIDPTAALRERERRAIRLYAVVVVAGSSVALSAFAVLGLPIVVEGVLRAFDGLVDGVRHDQLARTVDSALIIVVEAVLQLIFVVTFLRRHRHWFGRNPTRQRPAGE